MMAKRKQPMQPLYRDDSGTIRFQENKLVTYLLDNGGIDLNKLAVYAQRERIPHADQEQLAQLIGYSVSGFGELSYVRDDIFEEASEKADKVV